MIRALRKRLTGSGFHKNKKGSAAVEFAVIVPVFLGLMFSIFEVGWFYFANATVSAATTKASRLVRTGQAQQANMTKQEFFDEVCNVVQYFGDCSEKLTVDVAMFADFAALAADTSTATCGDAPEEDLSNIPYAPGVGSQIVRVRICFLYKTINPAIGVNLTEEGSTERRITSTLVFQNEPYEKNT